MKVPGDLIFLVGLFFEFICQSADLMGVRNQLMAPLGQCNGMVDPLKQQTAQIFLKLLNLKRDSRLRISQLLRCLCKAPQFRYMDKGDQIS